MALMCHQSSLMSDSLGSGTPFGNLGITKSRRRCRAEAVIER